MVAGTQYDARSNRMLEIFATGAKVYRAQMYVLDGNELTAPTWQYWMDSQLNQIEADLSQVPVNKKIILCPMNPPGGMLGNKARMFLDQPWGRQFLIDYWRGIALRYKGDRRFWFDLLNEPGCSVQQCNDLMRDLRASVRGADNRAIVLTTPKYCSYLDLPSMPFYGNSRDKYKFHFYDPRTFIDQEAGHPRKYPTTSMNKANIIKRLKPARDFQLKHKCEMVVGEFSVSPQGDDESNYRYVKDCVDVFNGYGWHWAFHEIEWAHKTEKIFNYLKKEWSR